MKHEIKLAQQIKINDMKCFTIDIIVHDVIFHNRRNEIIQNSITSQHQQKIEIRHFRLIFKVHFNIPSSEELEMFRRSEMTLSENVSTEV